MLITRNRIAGVNKDGRDIYGCSKMLFRLVIAIWVIIKLACHPYLLVVSYCYIGVYYMLVARYFFFIFLM